MIEKAELLIKNIMTSMMNLDLLAYFKFEIYKKGPWFLCKCHQSAKMCALKDLYPALVAICILPRDIICRWYHINDIAHKIVSSTPSPTRHSTRDPEWSSVISYSEVGYLDKRLLPPPELKMGKQSTRKHKSANQGY